MKKFVILLLASVAALIFATSAPAVELDVGGEIRFRHDQRDNADFDDSSSDGTRSVDQRIRINARLTLDEQTEIFLSIQDSRKWGDERGVATTSNESESTDLDEAWLKIQNTFGPFTLKMGRQRLAYGDQRLVSDSEWDNHANRFDALKVFLNNDIMDFDVFFSKTKTSEEISGDSNIDDHFHGLYASFKKIVPTAVWDLYVFQKKVDDPDALLTGQNILTIGTLLKGKVAFFEWSAEYAEQSGRFRKTSDGDIDQDARFSALTAACAFGGAFDIRIGAELTRGTGDKQGTDDRNESFDNLFPDYHEHYGMSDIRVGGIDEDRRVNNLKAYNFNLSFTLFKKAKFKTSYWSFSKETASEKYGSELNFQAWYELTPNIDLHAYYAAYTPKDDIGEDKFERTIIQLRSKF